MESLNHLTPDQLATDEGKQQALALINQHVAVLTEALANPASIECLVFFVAHKDSDKAAAGMFGTTAHVRDAVQTLEEKCHEGRNAIRAKLGLPPAGVNVDHEDFEAMRSIRDLSHAGAIKGPEDLSPEQNALIKKMFAAVKNAGESNPTIDQLAKQFGYDTDE